MKLYDPDATCAKCGQTPVASRFCDRTGEWWPFGPDKIPHPRAFTTNGHIHRTCPRCDFDWLELALDSRELTPEEVLQRHQERRAALGLSPVERS